MASGLPAIVVDVVVTSLGRASTISRYLKPSKLALDTTIQRIDAQRRASGEAAKWEQGLAEMKKNLRDVPQKCHKLVESGESRNVEKPATAR